MSQSQAQTGAVVTKTSVPAPLPAVKPAPVPLDPTLLRQVSGGTTQSPHATW